MNSVRPANFDTIARQTRRKAFFSFHFGDIMRVNNVRNAWKIDHPDSPQNRSFYDSSLWEEKRLTDPEQIKALIRQGVEYTSAVCVLIGAETWKRRWVKYEIARSVIDGKGLLGVHLNGLNHHQTHAPHDLGYNPIKLMGLAAKNNGSLCLCEWVDKGQGGRWDWYGDYTSPVSVPKYMRHPELGQPQSLAAFTREYDFARQQGHKNLGAWIDLAATEAGR